MSTTTTRLERKTDEARALYETLPAEERARFETGLAAAYESVKHSTNLPQIIKRSLLELAGMVIADGVVAGRWEKVHQGISRWPALYVHVRDIIPRGGDALSL